MNKNWNARGTRHEALPATKLTRLSICKCMDGCSGTYEKPNVTQFESEKPAIFIIISMTINLPRQLAFEVSPCHTGADAISNSYEVRFHEHCSLPVDVLMPFPIPAMILTCDKQPSL
jgi:hypothetical protein